MRVRSGSARAKLLMAVVGAALVALAPAHSAGGRTQTQNYVDARLAFACAPDYADYEYSAGGACFRVQLGDDYLQELEIQDKSGQKVRGLWQVQYKQDVGSTGPLLGAPQDFCGSWSGQESLENVEFILVKLQINIDDPKDPLGQGRFPDCSQGGGTIGEITATFGSASPASFGLMKAGIYRPS